MLQQEVTRIFRNTRTNPSLIEKLNVVPDVETFVEIARKQDYEFTIE